MQKVAKNILSLSTQKEAIFKPRHTCSTPCSLLHGQAMGLLTVISCQQRPSFFFMIFFLLVLFSFIQISSCYSCPSSFVLPAFNSSLGTDATITPPWAIATGSNEWLSTISYSPDLVSVRDEDHLLLLMCELDSWTNFTFPTGPNNNTYLAGAVTSGDPLPYGFIDFSLQTSSNFWETVIQGYEYNQDDSYDYLVVGIAPTYIYISVGVGLSEQPASPAPAILDLSISLTSIFGPSFDGSHAFHDYSILRTASSFAVYLGGTTVGGFTRGDLNGRWPFMRYDYASVPFYVMQSNLNSRAGDNATALISQLSATSLECYEVNVGVINALHVSFPSGTADLLITDDLADDDDETLMMLYSDVQLLDTSKSPAVVVAEISVPINPRWWTRTNVCDEMRFSNDCTYTSMFHNSTSGFTIQATYSFYDDDMVSSLGNQALKLRGGDFRLDFAVLVAPTIAPEATLLRVDLVLASGNQVNGNFTAVSNFSTLNLQAGPIAMNVSFFEWNSQLNTSTVMRAAYRKSNARSAVLSANFTRSNSLVAFFRVENFDQRKKWFKWWMGLLIGLAGAGLLIILILLVVRFVVPLLRKWLRRRRRRAIELRAAKVVTA